MRKTTVVQCDQDIDNEPREKMLQRSAGVRLGWGTTSDTYKDPDGQQKEWRVSGVK